MSEEASYIRCKPAKKIDLVSGKERFSVEKRNFFGQNNDGIATDKKNFCATPQKQAIQSKIRPETSSNSIKKANALGVHSIERRKNYRSNKKKWMPAVIYKF